MKKGDKSVGVGWQYCGNVGKISNSQVAVFACLSNGDFASMVDARLYLPQDWCEDPERCEEAGIPEGNRAFKTKLELAEEIIRQQVQNGVSFDFIGGDGYYGNDANLEQYTHQALAYIQAQRFFVEHCIKESKQILGIDQFQTRKWLAWQHQVALNLMVSSFILKEKLRNFEELPLLSANDIKKWFVFKLYKEMTEEQFFDQMHQRHKIRKRDINNSYQRF